MEANHKRSASHRSPREHEQIKKASLTQRITGAANRAASKFIETAAPPPSTTTKENDDSSTQTKGTTNISPVKKPEEATWAGDESETEMSPAYRKKLQQVRENEQEFKKDTADNTVEQEEMESDGFSLDSKLTIDTSIEEQPKVQLSVQQDNKSISNMTIDSMLTTEAENAGINVNKFAKENGTVKKDGDEAGLITETETNQNQEIDFPPNDDNLEEEDEINSIDSGNNTTISKKNLDKTVLPRMMRYQLMITPFKKSSQEDFDEDENFAGKVRDKLILMCNELLQSDKDAKIITWRCKKTFTYLNMGSFPDETPDIAKYFQGYRDKVRGDRRVYLKFAVHSPRTPFQRIEKDLQEWAKLYDYSVSRCLIQSDNAAFIGWICYSSYYTEIDLLRRILEKSSNFEWGFKMISVTDTDKHLQWNKRLKALGVYVPSDSANIATNIITKVMEAEPSPDCYLEYIEKFLFVPPKSTLNDLDSKIAYKSFVMRHRMHNKNLIGQFEENIKIDIDRYIPIRNNQQATLRHLILAIEITDPENPLVGTPLFHSIDFTADSEKQWFGNRFGPGGEGHIFTYYKQNEAEAKKMIRGLGVYLAKYYGSAGIRKCFEQKHWDGNKGWKYSSAKEKFHTPQDNHMKNNLVHDHNKAAMDIMLEMELLEIERQEVDNPTIQDMLINLPPTEVTNGESTQENNNADLYREAQDLAHPEEVSSYETDISRALQQEEIELIRKFQDADMDSTDRIGHKRKEVHNINCSSDVSETSSVTFGSNESLNSADSVQSLDSHLTTQDLPKAFKGKTIESFFEKEELSTLTDEEIHARLTSWFAHKKGKEKISMDAAISGFLQQRKQSASPPATPKMETKNKISAMVTEESKDDKDNSPGSSDNTAKEP